MRISNVIICAQCGTPCGRHHESTHGIDGWDPAFDEGKGEDFTLDGKWHCSQACLDEAKAEQKENEDESNSRPGPSYVPDGTKRDWTGE